MVTLPGGGALELELIRDCTAAIVAKGVGLFKTEAQVTAAIAEGIASVIDDLKRESRKATGIV